MVIKASACDVWYGVILIHTPWSTRVAIILCTNFVAVFTAELASLITVDIASVAFSTLTIIVISLVYALQDKVAVAMSVVFIAC